MRLTGRRIAEIGLPTTRELSRREIDLLHYIRNAALDVGDVIDSLAEEADPCWLAIAKTDLQKGFMALSRAIAQPEPESP